MAELRLNHPEASLEELGQLAVPPLSKSGVSSRMRRLTREAALLAQTLQEGRA